MAAIVAHACCVPPSSPQAFYAAFQLSPWPSALLIRHAFDKGAKAIASVALHVPKAVSVQRDLSYAPGDGDALFDVFAPADASAAHPAVAWVHGGGFIAGTRSDLSDYLRALASRGFVTVAIDYSVAPAAQFPTPVPALSRSRQPPISAEANLRGAAPGRHLRRA